MSTMMTAKLSQAQTLTAIADFAEVFCSTDGETAFATIEMNGHRETWPIRSKGFRRWLVGRFYQVERKPPGAQALQDALGAIEARAQFAGQVHPVAVRVAGDEEAIYLDLGNPDWEAVQITPSGWRIVAEPPMKFRRSRGMLPLPHPVRGGSLKDLRPFVNVASDDQWVLLQAWLVAAFRPRGPYPVLDLAGEQGTAKSTTARVLRALIDPNTAPLRAEPADVRDLMIAATNGWVIALDNISALPAWLSDALARLATGGGLATRELYTDAEEAIFEAQRPVIVNGIEEIITRPDLLDRALLLDFQVIPDERRRAEADFWREFAIARPRILGSLLDTLSMALGRHKDVRLAVVPRMADFAIWATAAGPALGWTDRYFVDVYTGNRAAAHELALDASPVAPLIRALADTLDEEKAVAEWAGTATELLKNLNEMADETVSRERGWPTRGRDISGVLRRLAADFRAVGVLIEFQDRPELGRRRRQIVIRKAGGFHRSQRSERSDADPQRSEPNADQVAENAEGTPETPRQNAGNASNAESGYFSGVTGGLEEVDL